VHSDVAGIVGYLQLCGSLSPGVVDGEQRERLGDVSPPVALIYPGKGIVRDLAVQSDGSQADPSLAIRR
jgi:hypothetical protein